MNVKGTQKRKATAAKDKKLIKKPKISFPQNIGAPSGKGPEWKQFDVTSGAIALSSGVGGWTTPVLVNGIASGTGVTQRLGRKLLMRKMILRLYDQWTNGTISGFCPLRVVVIYDREPQGAVPAITDIFDVNTLISNMNLSNSDRFLVLVDTQEGDWAGFAGFNPAQASAVGCLAPVIVRNFPQGLESQYKDVTTGVIADFTKGACYIMASQDVTAVFSGGTTRTLDYVIRWRFTDQ